MNLLRLAVLAPLVWGIGCDETVRKGGDAAVDSGGGADGRGGAVLPLEASVIEASASDGGRVDSEQAVDRGPSAGCRGFVEAGGLVVIEVESAPVADDWSRQSRLADHTGSGYYEWKHGDTAIGTDVAGQGILSYAICVATTGRYQLHIRSAAPNPTDHNDVWVRFPDTGAVKNKGTGDVSLGTDWFKVYQNASNDAWQWKTKTTDNDAHDIFVDVYGTRGFKLELSGRSSLFKVDRIVLRHDAVTVSQATRAAIPESPSR